MVRVWRFVFAAALLAFPSSMSHFAAQAQAMSACDGAYYNIVRVSEIKSGMMAKFLSAVAAQRAWYKAAGTSDEIVLMRVVDRDAGSLSETQALTSHIVPPGAKQTAHNAGYDAFVAMFKESSTIKQEYVTCVVKP